MKVEPSVDLSEIPAKRVACRHLDIIERFLPEPAQSFFLFGPRGTGKSTWLRKRIPGAIYLDLLDPETFRLYSARPERLRELVEGNPGRRAVVIHEVQKIPELLPVVHLLLEREKKPQFILTGSSARKLKRTGIDLLAGRALLKTCHPFIASELGSEFELERALQLGLLPLVVDSDDPEGVLKAYASLYLREEVQAERLVRKVGDFSRFLEAISFSHGDVLNISEVARECAVGRKTVEGYVGVLEDLLLCFHVPVFNKRARRKLVVREKFYYFDCGVYRSLRPAGPVDRPEEIGGAALEGLVAQHLRAWNDYSGSENKLFYWRTKAGNEVDFVIYGEREFTGIEVKSTRNIRGKDLRGLKAFEEDYPEARLILLYRGTERLRLGNVLCCPCEVFLRGLRPGEALASHSSLAG